MEDFDELDDDMSFAERHLQYDTPGAGDLGDFEGFDFDGLEPLGDDDYSEIEDPGVRESLDLERAYQALAAHRPDLLHPGVFTEPEVSPYQRTHSAAELAFRAMDARDQILSSVAGFGDEARSAALCVPSEEVLVTAYPCCLAG